MQGEPSVAPGLLARGEQNLQSAGSSKTHPLAVQNVNAAALCSTMGTEEIYTTGEDASLHAWSELWLTQGCAGVPAALLAVPSPGCPV